MTQKVVVNLDKASVYGMAVFYNAVNLHINIVMSEPFSQDF
jgi:hypothetical protein